MTIDPLPEFLNATQEPRASAGDTVTFPTVTFMSLLGMLILNTPSGNSVPERPRAFSTFPQPVSVPVDAGPVVAARAAQNKTASARTNMPAQIRQDFSIRMLIPPYLSTDTGICPGKEKMACNYSGKKARSPDEHRKRVL
jgi:hypothetical protein